MEHIQQLFSSADHIISEVRSLKSRNASLERKQTTYGEKIRKMGLEIETCKSVIATLEAEKAELKFKAEGLHDNLADLKVEKELSAEKLIEKDAQIDELQKRILELTVPVTKSVTDHFFDILSSIGISKDFIDELIKVGCVTFTGSSVTQAMLGERWGDTFDIDIITFFSADTCKFFTSHGYDVQVNRNDYIGFLPTFTVHRATKMIGETLVKFDIIAPASLLGRNSSSRDSKSDVKRIIRLIEMYDFTFCWNFFDGVDFWTLCKESLEKKTHFGRIPGGIHSSPGRYEKYEKRGFKFDIGMTRPKSKLEKLEGSLPPLCSMGDCERADIGDIGDKPASSSGFDFRPVVCAIKDTIISIGGNVAEIDGLLKLNGVYLTGSVVVQALLEEKWDSLSSSPPDIDIIAFDKGPIFAFLLEHGYTVKNMDGIYRLGASVYSATKVGFPKIDVLFPRGHVVSAVSTTEGRLKTAIKFVDLFDFEFCRVLFDGKKVHGANIARFALQNKTHYECLNFGPCARKVAHFPFYEERLSSKARQDKYEKRGFKFLEKKLGSVRVYPETFSTKYAIKET